MKAIARQRDVILEVNNLRKSYATRRGMHEALRGVSFSVRAGEVFGLLGPNGAGKSTMINILIGLLSANSGSIRIFGKDFFSHDHTWIRRRMNVSTAYAHLPSRLSVLENLRIFSHLYGITPKTKTLVALLDRFGIAGLAHKKIGALSSGQKALVNMCKALVNEPQLLLLDEPTSSLDPENALTARSALRTFADEKGMTILWTSHNMPEVEEVCDRIAFLLNGTIAVVDTPEHLLALSKVRTVLLTFPTASAARACAALSLPKGMRHENVDGRTVRIEVPHRQGAVPGLMSLVQKAGVDFSDLHVQQPNFEGVFLEFAKRQHRNQ